MKKRVPRTSQIHQHCFYLRRDVEVSYRVNRCLANPNHRILQTLRLMSQNLRAKYIYIYISQFLLTQKYPLSNVWRINFGCSGYSNMTKLWNYHNNMRVFLIRHFICYGILMLMNKFEVKYLSCVTLVPLFMFNGCLYMNKIFSNFKTSTSLRYGSKHTDCTC